MPLLLRRATRAAALLCVACDTTNDGVGPDPAADDACEVRVAETQTLLPNLIMPAHHEVKASDVMLRRLHATLAAAADRGPKDFASLLMTPSWNS